MKKGKGMKNNALPHTWAGPKHARGERGVRDLVPSAANVGE